MLRYLVEDRKAEGIVVGLFESDGSTRVVWHGNAGSTAPALGPGSVFETGSIGKTFTATLLADMVRNGEVALEDPVSKYLPDSVAVPSYDGRQITLLDLATHRSGFPKNAENHSPADEENPYADYTIQTLYEFLAGHRLRREPGARFEYSNLGFQLLGHALARAAGSSYADLHRERILDPLEMTVAGFTLDGERAVRMAQGFRNGYVVPSWTGTEARFGAGGLFSDVGDMLKYLKANVGPPGAELEQSMRMAHEPRMPWGDSGARVGLAWTVDSIHGRHIVQHGGNTGGFSSLIAFDPDRRVGIVWLTNTFAFADGTPYELLAQGGRPAIQELHLTSDVLAAFVGEYRFPSGLSLHVRLEKEGYLTIQYARRARVRMYAESDSSFTLDRGSTRMVFGRGKDGGIENLHMDPSQTGESARKVSNNSPPPWSVAAGTEWHRIGLEWRNVYWIPLAGLALLVVLTFGSEWLRFSKRRGGAGR
jgi:CubicO group peptidase (beta-lactamase class C family)